MTICLRSVAFRSTATDHGDGRTLEGYAAVFNEPTEINSWEGSFTEELAYGAFKKSIKARTPVMQFDHGRDPRTGTVPIASIQDLNEDDHGLFVRARLFDNDIVAPVRDAIAAEAISGMSFRFEVVKDEWRDVDGKLVSGSELSDLLWYGAGDRGPLKRTIREVNLFELGPVVFPAYDQTSVGVRSMLAGMSREDMLALAHELNKLAGRSDARSTGGSKKEGTKSNADTDKLRVRGIL